ncbi:hypothetical protein [Rickettsia endosymbiont of Ceutorhynchus obstrictus]|uniref:hypothetical protein n=1 Tax=Rickettsia endosymbiont of Ceutorhynchus obstrictus TaxID=3066249 RepID=UPI003132A56A
MREDLKRPLEQTTLPNYNSNKGKKQKINNNDLLVFNDFDSDNSDIDTNPTNLVEGDTTMELKKLNTRMIIDDINKFKEEYVKGEEAEEKFIQDYVEAHRQDNVSTKDDVYSLLLSRAIPAEDTLLIKHILSLPHESNILTNVNLMNLSPISVTIYSKNKEVLNLMAKYIESISGTIEKVNLTGSNYNHISSITRNPPNNMDPINCFKKFLAPLYTEKSLEKLADLIGVNDIEENFDFTA